MKERLYKFIAFLPSSYPAELFGISKEQGSQKQRTLQRNDTRTGKSNSIRISEITW
jgi:hypothetical protein